MKHRIYILLSFLIGISCYVVATKEEFFQELCNELSEIIKNKNKDNDYDKYRVASGGSVPGELADPLFQDCGKKGETGKEARKKINKIIENDSSLLKLLASRGND